MLSEANLGYGVIALSADGRDEPQGAFSPEIDGLLNRSPLPVLLVRRPSQALRTRETLPRHAASSSL